MKKLLKKEFALCLHPTAILFMFLAFLVFVPNYPYEIIFFFSSLSMFFICLTGRENGDLAFTCGLPVKKTQIPVARILMAVILQCALLLLTAVAIAIKEATFPADMQINYAGTSANVALLGFGAMVLGLFNLIFFGMHFKNPNKVGIPFAVASTAIFIFIAMLIVLRWTVPFFMETLNTVDPENLLAKIIVLAVGLLVYALLTLCAVLLAKKSFKNVDF